MRVTAQIAIKTMSNSKGFLVRSTRGSDRVAKLVANGPGVISSKAILMFQGDAGYTCTTVRCVS